MRTSMAFVMAAVALTLLPADALAATTSPVASLASLPPPAPLPEKAKTQDDGRVPGLSVKVPASSNGRIRWVEYSASAWRGYCVASPGPTADLTDKYTRNANGKGEDVDLLRLVEKDGKASLERTRVHVEGEGAAVVGRSSVDLREVGRSADVGPVFAYKDGHDVVVVARGVESGVESPSDAMVGADEQTRFASSSGCPFGIVRIGDKAAAAGTVARLTGALSPRGTGKDKVRRSFVVDVSLSRLARDPGPMLAVRVRTKD